LEKGYDGIVFTAGMDENAAAVWATICKACAWLGLDLDAGAYDRKTPGRISTSGSRVAAYVMRTDENLTIAHYVRETIREGAGNR
jgi:acetate kinase